MATNARQASLCRKYGKRTPGVGLPTLEHNNCVFWTSHVTGCHAGCSILFQGVDGSIIVRGIVLHT